ncbi:hypothetical protein [Deferribacter abyssi]|uniref:hypothetical protein n=1 Tax=Deferribacter abyssi TaxID=213806 RepID=UPI003C1FE921
MIAKIDEYGKLYLERAGKLKSQFCPFVSTPENMTVECGDWCPFFEEPIKVPDNKVTAIFTCKRTIYVNKLIDERQE